jgi:hypothetical protein
MDWAILLSSLNTQSAESSEKNSNLYYINNLAVQYNPLATIPCESRKVEGLGYNKEKMAPQKASPTKI